MNVSVPAAAAALSRNVTIALLVALFLFWAYKASDHAITIDEANSAYSAKTIELTDFFWGANFHPVNSLSIRVCTALFGESEFSIRLVNVLAGGGYLLLAYLLMRRRVVFGVAFLVVLVGNPYCGDFFALARGYGVGLFFLLVFLARFESGTVWASPSVGDAAKTVVVASLAVYCNYAYLVFVAPGIGMLFLNWIHQKRLRAALYLSAGSAVAFSPLLLIVRKMDALGLLYYGGRGDFWESTVASGIETYLYGMGYPDLVRTAVAVLFVVCSAVVAVNWVAVLCSDGSLSVGWRFASLLALGLCFCSFSASFLGKYYLVERTSIGFYPLLVFAVYWAVVELWGRLENGRARLAVRGAVATLAALAATHFVLCQIRYTNYSWFWDLGTEEFVGDLEAVAGEGKVTVGISPYHSPAFSYYLDKSAARERIEPDGDAVIFPLFNPGFAQISGEYYGSPVASNFRPEGIVKMLSNSNCQFYYVPDYYYAKVVRAGGGFELIKEYPKARMVAVSRLPRKTTPETVEVSTGSP